MSLSQTLGVPDLNSREILDLFLAQKYEAIATKYLSVFGHLEQKLYTKLPTPLKVYLEEFLGNFFYIFSQAEFVLPEKFSRPFIRCNRIIANLTAISSFETTDTYIEILLNQTDSLNKILTLYSPHNSVFLDYSKLFSRG